MPVYVDEFPGDGWGKWNGGGHMLATDMDELHEMAANLGLKRRWFQDKRWPHYDLTKSKRDLAIRIGAIPVEPGGAPDTVLMRNPDGSYEPEHEWKREKTLEEEWLMPTKIHMTHERRKTLESMLKPWKIKVMPNGAKLGIECPYCHGKALVSAKWRQPRTYECHDGSTVLIIGRSCTYCFKTAKIPTK